VEQIKDVTVVAAPNPVPLPAHRAGVTRVFLVVVELATGRLLLFYHPRRSGSEKMLGDLCVVTSSRETVGDFDVIFIKSNKRVTLYQKSRRLNRKANRLTTTHFGSGSEPAREVIEI
jgi:hypothetical protein